MFQRVSAAHRVLSDSDLRETYLRGEDTGIALDEEVGSLTDQVCPVQRHLFCSCLPVYLPVASRQSHWTLTRPWHQVERRYFPERTGFRAFGDPYERKRPFQQRLRAEAEARRRNSPDSRDEL
jgi:curved DNA-binding protein CbpA